MFLLGVDIPVFLGIIDSYALHLLEVGFPLKRIKSSRRRIM